MEIGLGASGRRDCRHTAMGNGWTAYPEPAGAQLRENDPADSGGDEDHNDSYDDGPGRRYHPCLGECGTFSEGFSPESGRNVTMQESVGQVRWVETTTRQTGRWWRGGGCGQTWQPWKRPVGTINQCARRDVG